MSGVRSERLTMAQALVRFLAAQHVERDGIVTRFFPGCFGIFGHGNLAGMGQALDQYAALLPYHPARNEQGMVHIAVGYRTDARSPRDVRLHQLDRPRGRRTWSPVPRSRR